MVWIFFFIRDRAVFNNNPESIPRSYPDCALSCIWVFDNFILAEELFAKALRSFETYVLVNNYAENYFHH